jgi:hypothetical protein
VAVEVIIAVKFSGGRPMETRDLFMKPELHARRLPFNAALIWVKLHAKAWGSGSRHAILDGVARGNPDFSTERGGSQWLG